MAKENVEKRILRIISAWDFRKDIQDYLYKESFDDTLKQLEKYKEIFLEDRDLFFNEFYKISAANHLFTMLVHPISQNEGYKFTVKGLILLTKAAHLLDVEEIRAINAKGIMESDPAKREEMAVELRNTIEDAYTVILTANEHVTFINSDKNPVATPIKMFKHEDTSLARNILMVSVPINVWKGGKEERGTG